MENKGKLEIIGKNRRKYGKTREKRNKIEGEAQCDEDMMTLAKKQ